MRYQISRLIPVPMRSTYREPVAGADVQAGGHGNHHRDDDHVDIVTSRWWQWRGRVVRQRTVTVCA